MLIQCLLLLAVFGLMDAARSFAPHPGTGTSAAGVALGAGFIMLAALFSGNLFKSIGLPRLTGYLALGVLTGPHVAGLVTDDMLSELRIFNGVAIALIALTAGTEMDFRSMRPLMRGIAWITGIGVIGTIALISVSAYFLSGLLPFMSSFDPVQKAAIAVVLGITLSSQSPAVAVALRTETQADGPLTRTVLGVVVLSDLVVILMFAIASTITRSVIGSAAGDNPLTAVTWEVFGSAGAGILIGILIATCLNAVRSSGGLFIITIGFLVAEVGQRIHLDPLLVALAAGMLIRNATVYGDRVHAEIEGASLPVYIGFFAVAGATIHLDALAIVGVPATIFVLIRAAGFLGGCRLAAIFAGSPKTVRQYVGYGLLPQAGLALALALLFTRTFPQFGPEASALVFGIVGLNELLAPALYRWALIRSGEAGRLIGAHQELESAEYLPDAAS
jgi:Kef-type K+ transport system membrane component KefB